MKALDKIILGTVQLGLPYGINNSKGMPTTDESIQLLSFAYKSGIRTLDTAEAYGMSQKIIGIYHNQNSASKFNVITKYSKSVNNNDDIIFNVENDLKELSIASLGGYMFHNYPDYLANKNQLPKLISLKKRGIIKKLGVSVYTNEEIDSLLDNDEIDFIQLPFNLLDNNNLRLSSLKKLKDRNKEVHIRSAFLQGLFYRSLDELPDKLTILKHNLKQIHEISAAANISMSSLALGYAIKNQFIDHVLIGVDNKQQLANNVEDINTSSTIPDMFFNQIDEIHVLEKELLNPVNW
jgi:aryl-alcohol dehydrogenase-like predicted oxidoreductase